MLLVLAHPGGPSALSGSLSYERRVEAARVIERVYPGQPDHLAFEDRVGAQRAILRVYLSHQEGLKQAPDEKTLDQVARRKVRTYLALSGALQDRWNLQVTPAMLQAELDRIARNTRFPERLREIYTALGDDPFLIAESFVRQVLVERLARNFHPGDDRVHSAAREEAEEIRRYLLDGELDPGNDHPRRIVTDEAGSRAAGERLPSRGPGDIPVSGVIEKEDRFEVSVQPSGGGDGDRRVVYTVPKQGFDEWWTEHAGAYESTAVLPSRAEYGGFRIPAADLGAASIGCSDDDTWDNGGMGELPVFGAGAKAVWTGTLVLIWGVGRYDPLTDTWLSMSSVGQPSPRARYTAVWTGTHMIVWGGDTGAVFFNTGGMYDPVSDSWSPTSTLNAPEPRSNHTAVWTGTEMIVWGGSRAGGSPGGRYDPVSDRWTPTALSGAPSPRAHHSAVWIGTEMIVWGGVGHDIGGRYDPVSDTWGPVSPAGEPTLRHSHAAIWTGSLMLIWGGESPVLAHLTDAAYDPATDSWRPMTSEGRPIHREDPSAAWTGSRMLVWGGGAASFESGTGGQYDPVTDTWTPTALLNAPEPRSRHAWAWTGELLIVWGGRTDFDSRTLATGGRYDPQTDTWTPMLATSNLPQPRWMHTAVWTGNEMIVWGGWHWSAYRGDGYRYDPLTDSWSRTSLVGAPAPRANHTAVWTGAEMIIWGGDQYDLHLDRFERFDSGGRYDPLADIWTPTSLDGAPPPRKLHTAVWTGEEMIVWGGIDQSGLSGASPLDSGGVYDPVADSWTATPLVDAPEGRFFHTAVWSGREMILWGGLDGSEALGTGGRYDPSLGLWREISLTDSPIPRLLHAAVWTGEEMIVWGGDAIPFRFGTLDTGSRYDPAADSWRPISSAGAPEARAQHQAVWTGRQMVIWGGNHTSIRSLATGGRYDPATDLWSPTTTVGAPSARVTHSMVWSGTHAIVWGGIGGESTGGRYVIFDPPDVDGDGFTVCTGDCDESDPFVHGGADEICDGKDNDCDGALPAEEADADGDGFLGCGGDCDDGNPSVNPAAPDLPVLLTRTATETGSAIRMPGGRAAGSSSPAWHAPAIGSCRMERSCRAIAVG